MKHIRLTAVLLLVAACGSPAGKVPQPQVLDLSAWVLSIPTVPPQEIRQPQLDSYRSEFFQNNFKDGRGAVRFTVPPDGGVQIGANFPRTEMYEKKVWSSTEGRHVLEMTQEIAAVPDDYPVVVGFQIHDPFGDILMLELDRKVGKSLLHLKTRDPAIPGSGVWNAATLETDYKLGTIYTLRVTAEKGLISVDYNGKRALDFPLVKDEMYFKAGAYLQKTPSPGNGVGVTNIYSLKTQHDG